jgi:hypothetical protein
MAKVQVRNYYESISRDPATLGQPVVAVSYTLDGAGPFEFRMPRQVGWEAKFEAAVRADAAQRGKLLKIAFDL